MNGIPQIGQWSGDVKTCSNDAPDLLATFANDGAIYDASIKAVAIQQLEGRLARLGLIIEELRRLA